MTPKQALAACVAIDSTRTYCAKQDDWDGLFWNPKNKERFQRTDYTIAVSPALDGSDCEHFRRPDGFAACVAEYRAAHAAEYRAE